MSYEYDKYQHFCNVMQEIGEKSYADLISSELTETSEPPTDIDVERFCGDESYLFARPKKVGEIVLVDDE